MSIGEEWSRITELCQSIFSSQAVAAAMSTSETPDRHISAPIARLLLEVTDRIESFLQHNDRELGASVQRTKASREATVELLKTAQNAGNSTPARYLRRATSELLYTQFVIDQIVQSAPPRDTYDVQRAFIHLQCRIRAEEPYRKLWHRAFNKHETHCEALGAAHLLQHGIWAFKAAATGKLGRTDLVLGSETLLERHVKATRSTLVLTEWKKHRGEAIERLVSDAINQACKYAKEPLHGFELTSTRFIVVVSDTDTIFNTDIDRHSDQYSVINIAIGSETPSNPGRREKRSFSTRKR